MLLKVIELMKIMLENIILFLTINMELVKLLRFFLWNNFWFHKDLCDFSSLDLETLLTGTECGEWVERGWTGGAEDGTAPSP